MNVELVKQWIEALESGKYKKGISQLRRGNCYCAVGVLCDIIDHKRWSKANSYITISSDEINPLNLIDYSWYGNTCSVPTLVKKKTGMKHSYFEDVIFLSDRNNDFAPVVNKLNEFIGIHKAKLLI